MYHDLGKISEKFQSKIKGKFLKNEIPHGVLSTAFLNYTKLKEKFTKEEIKILYSSIYYHHHRDSLNFLTVYEINEEIELLKEETKHFKYDKIENLENLKFKKGNIINFNEDIDENLLYNYIKIKGLLNKIDYSASSGVKIEIKNDFLIESMNNFFIKNNINKNDLQLFLEKNTNNNVIAIAQTGFGKTEAGLLWIGNNKGFFTLPLKTAINAMYERIKNNILENENIENRLGLLHSQTKEIYFKQEDIINNTEDYYNKTKQLSLPITVCTLDQLFTFVFKYKNYEYKLATLSYSKIVIDEIQIYSSDILAFILSSLKELEKINSKYAILTATFSPFLRDLMKQNNLNFVENKEAFINKDINRHKIKLIKNNINSDFILSKYNNNKILVICNTVKECQRLYLELKEKMNLDEEDEKIEDRELICFHAKFINKDKKERENSILNFSNDRNKKGIYITNMIVEASLDIDFDILITELSEINSFFQRLGRCYRKRQLTGDSFNVYLFLGKEDKNCSGIGKVIDRDLHFLSRQKLINFFNKNKSGILTEQDKMNIINETYTTQNLKNFKYYQNILDFLSYTKNLLIAEKNANEAQKIFRNINTSTILLKQIYEEHKFEIDELILNYKSSGNIKEKVEIIGYINNYMLDVEYYIIQKNKPIEIINLNNYFDILIYDLSYNSEVGLELNKLNSFKKIT